MINWKIVVIFPFFAVVISILSGAIGGVSLLDIVLRAILWAIVFGGIGIGVSFIIDRFFPELKGVGEGEADKAVAKGSSEIGFEAFIPEDNPHELEEVKSGYYSEDDDAPDNRIAGRQNRENDEEVGELSGEEETGSVPASDVEGADEVGSDAIAGLGFDSDGSSDSDLGFEPDAKPAMDSRNRGKESLTDEEDESSLVFDDDSIDKLPDSGSFEDSGSLPSKESSFDSRGVFSKPYKGTTVGEFEQDPHKTAKAIHTMMQRDKEG